MAAPWFASREWAAFWWLFLIFCSMTSVAGEYNAFKDLLQAFY